MGHGTDDRSACAKTQVCGIRRTRLEHGNIIIDRAGDHAGGGIFRAAGGVAEDNTVGDTEDRVTGSIGIDTAARSASIVSGDRHTAVTHGSTAGCINSTAVSSGSVAVECAVGNITASAM